MPDLFNEKIDGRQSWSRIFQSAEAFGPLIENIFQKHRLPFTRIEHCTPGTNAVFKAGDHIIKIFAPPESGFSAGSAFETALFGLRRANRLGVPAPALTAGGSLFSRFRFDYIITEFIAGEEFGKAEHTFTDEDKFGIGAQLRQATVKLNTGCVRFNDIDVVKDKSRDEWWDGFCENFRTERREYINSHDFGRLVFVHGDLNPDNVIVGPDGRLRIIDFADALRAPPEYELAALVFELFCFEKPYMSGYFGNFDPAGLAGRVFDGLLLHEFGAGMIRSNLGGSAGITGLKILEDRILAAISRGGQLR